MEETPRTGANSRYRVSFSKSTLTGTYNGVYKTEVIVSQSHEMGYTDGHLALLHVSNNSLIADDYYVGSLRKSEKICLHENVCLRIHFWAFYVIFYNVGVHVLFCISSPLTHPIRVGLVVRLLLPFLLIQKYPQRRLLLPGQQTTSSTHVLSGRGRSNNTRRLRRSRSLKIIAKRTYRLPPPLLPEIIYLRNYKAVIIENLSRYDLCSTAMSSNHKNPVVAFVAIWFSLIPLSLPHYFYRSKIVSKLTKWSLALCVLNDSSSFQNRFTKHAHQTFDDMPQRKFDPNLESKIFLSPKVRYECSVVALYHLPPLGHQEEVEQIKNNAYWAKAMMRLTYTSVGSFVSISILFVATCFSDPVKFGFMYMVTAPTLFYPVYSTIPETHRLHLNPSLTLYVACLSPSTSTTTTTTTIAADIIASPLLKSRISINKSKEAGEKERHNYVLRCLSFPYKPYGYEVHKMVN
ncbi:unnamed protein product [Lactuca virosa]|uniref:Uncharacterized protein n=1 Tax=Lactuca virosa TaxID=75947 RepID=A0AAU9LMS3_9ASTR|nr:unnamed protein product [Lactuca virosa]